MGQLGGPDADRINGARLHEFRKLKLIPVAHAYDTVGQLHGAAAFIHIRDANHKVRILAVGGDIKFSPGISCNGQVLR